MKSKLALLPLLISSSCYGNSIEVLHWWTATGERESQQVVEQDLLSKNIAWQNFAIVGEGGEGAIRVLQMRALSGNPPDAAQIKGPDIGEWHKLAMLKRVEQVIDTSQWPLILPKVVRDSITFDNQYMAIPVNIHRVNWLWSNNKIFKQLGLDIPTTWPQFFVAADKIKQAGYIVLAHGGTAWQDSLLFESMALSILGADLYIKAFVEHDETVLTSKQMINVFEQFKRLKKYTSKQMIGKDWFQASQLLASDKAAMQFMGDWAKGYWHASGLVAMQDYSCSDIPGVNKSYSYNIDSFVLFEKNSIDEQVNVQSKFANTLLSKSVQTEFNIRKGSIPVRNDIDIKQFDSCAQKSYQDFNNTQLVPSFTQNLATTSHIQNIMTRMISGYFNDPHADATDTVKRLAVALRAVN